MCAVEGFDLASGEASGTVEVRGVVGTMEGMDFSIWMERHVIGAEENSVQKAAALIRTQDYLRTER